MQKGFAPILLLIIILILAVIVGGYYLGKSQIPKSVSQNYVISTTPQPTLIPSPSPDETANWKVFSDSVTDFILKYPSDWGQEEKAFDTLAILTMDPVCKTCGGRERGIYIYLHENKDKLTAREYFEKIVKPKLLTPKLLDSQPAYFQNLDAVVAEGFGGAGSPGLVAFISKGQNVIELFSDGIDEATTNKIFSTFKFTN